MAALLQSNSLTGIFYTLCHAFKIPDCAGKQSVFTLAVSGFSATMNMKLMLTRSVPLQMQMMQPSKSASVFPMVSNEDKILGSWGKQFCRCYFGLKKKKKKTRAENSKYHWWLKTPRREIHREWNMMQTVNFHNLDLFDTSKCKHLV